MRTFFHFLSRLQLLLGKVDYIPRLIDKKPLDSDVPANTLVLVGHQDLPKWALLKCPCGCNDTLTLSLMKRFSPYWLYKTDKWNRIDLSPSIRKKDGCLSHFFIKKGKVIWCQN